MCAVYISLKSVIPMHIRPLLFTLGFKTADFRKASIDGHFQRLFPKHFTVNINDFVQIRGRLPPHTPLDPRLPLPFSQAIIK
jgi:hypothetical protein